MHELRDPVLSQRLPPRQRRPPTERPRVSEPVAQALDQLLAPTTSRSSPGRLCPATCEGVLRPWNQLPTGGHQQIELEIIESHLPGTAGSTRATLVRTGKRSPSSARTPADLAAADQLNRAGHRVTVFERADRIGGLLPVRDAGVQAGEGNPEPPLTAHNSEGVTFDANAKVGVNSR